MMLLVPGIVILLNEAEILLPFTLQSQLPSFHVGGEVALEGKGSVSRKAPSPLFLTQRGQCLRSLPGSAFSLRKALRGGSSQGPQHCQHRIAWSPPFLTWGNLPAAGLGQYKAD